MGRERRVIEGWKDIAEHLARSSGVKVTIHRARSWEARLGLPVHRLGRPFAYVDELDEWVREQARSRASG